MTPIVRLYREEAWPFTWHLQIVWNYGRRGRGSYVSPGLGRDERPPSMYTLRKVLRVMWRLPR